MTLLLATKRDFVSRMLALMSPVERDIISTYLQHARFQDEDGLPLLADFVEQPLAAVEALLGSSNFIILKDCLDFIERNQPTSRDDVARWLGSAMRGEEGIGSTDRMKAATTLLALQGETTDRVETVVKGMENPVVAAEAAPKAMQLVGQLVYQLYLSGGVESVRRALDAAMHPLPKEVVAELKVLPTEVVDV